MSPETIDGFINAGLWLTDQVDTYGPGLTAAATAWAGWWAIPRVARRATNYRNRQRDIAAWRRQLDDERQQMADLSAIEGIEQIEAELAATWERLQTEAREGEK